jgi:hypothetical protein
MDASLLFSVVVIVMVTVLGSALIVHLAGDHHPAERRKLRPGTAPAPVPTPAAPR